MSELGAVGGPQVQDPGWEHFPRVGGLQGGQRGCSKREPSMVEDEELERGLGQGQVGHTKHHGFHPECDAKSLEDSKRGRAKVMESWRVREVPCKSRS